LGFYEEVTPTKQEQQQLSLIRDMRSVPDPIVAIKTMCICVYVHSHLCHPGYWPCWVCLALLH